MKLTPVVFSNSIDHALTCPICGEDYLHQSNVTVIAKSSTGMSQLVEVHDTDTTVTPIVTENPDMVRTSFTCEHGCTVPDLVTFQHKGNTIVGWDNG
jgi:hypothetical protein